MAHPLAKGHHQQILSHDSPGMLSDILTRSENIYTGKNADQFLEMTFDRLQRLTNCKDVIIHGDLGFL